MSVVWNHLYVILCSSGLANQEYSTHQPIPLAPQSHKITCKSISSNTKVIPRFYFPGGSFHWNSISFTLTPILILNWQIRNMIKGVKLIVLYPPPSLADHREACPPITGQHPEVIPPSGDCAFMSPPDTPPFFIHSQVFNINSVCQRVFLLK